MADAQRLAGLSWHWLMVDTSEVIRGLDGAIEAAPIAFARSDRQVEIAPNIDAIQFAANRVYVVGSAYEPEPVICDEPPAAEPLADDQGRPTVQRTSSYKPFSDLFDTPGSYSTTPTLAEQKTILYAYQDRRYLDEVLPSELQADYNAVIGQDYDLQPNEPLFTATIKKQPFGALFPESGTNTALVIGEAIVETPIAKVVWQPKGVLSGDDQDLTLIVKTRETLTTNFIPAAPNSSPAINPQTGTHTCLEKPPEKEAPQIAPERPLKEVPIVGLAQTQYSGWTPIIDNPLIENFGFLPDTGVANALARQIARREERRRDSWLVKMPIAVEWAVLGFRPLSLCDIGGRRLQMDGIALGIKAGEASMEFEGGWITGGYAETQRSRIAIRLLVSALAPTLVTGGGGGGGGQG